MKKTLIFDTECYANYWLLTFRNVDSGKVTTFEIYEGEPFDADKIRKILSQYRIVGFNSIGYDIPIIFLALQSADLSKINKANDLIINHKYKPWMIEDHFKFKIPRNLDHIDLIEVAPGKASLKIYGGRMHAKTVWELPYVADEIVTPEKREEIRLYNINDLETTELLYKTLIPQIELREKMSIEYKLDMRSKSDAQIAEAVINSKLEEKNGVKPQKNVIKPETVFRYKKPDFISFNTKIMEDTLTRLEDCLYVTDHAGKIKMSDPLDKETIPFGSANYRIGIGGLHSSEKSIAHYADEEYVIVDRDVTSYYPNIIMNCSLFPAHMGKDFLSVYVRLIQERVKAKREGNKTEADSKKLVCNGSFGKFGSRWSTLYSPDLLIQTTITGQLSLFMLIEMLEQHGAQVLSANTDGMTFRCRKKDKKHIDNVIAGWELTTGFNTEETPYRMICSANVNNYIALKTDNKAKLKGAYTPPGLQKNPVNQVCVDAAIAYLKNGTRIEDTIFDEMDVRKFVTVRTVKGGAVKNDIYLGKAIRWYYKSGETGTINYKLNNYTVARTEGAYPLMTLPEKVPRNVDYDWYVNEAYSILKDIGVTK